QSCEDILDKLAAERPEAVILDESQGADVCRAIKKRTAGELVPVLLVTSGSPMVGFKAGADDVIRRPLDAEELCARVDVWLRTRRLTLMVQNQNQNQPRATTDGLGRDPLTGLPDARAFTQKLQEEFERAQREHSPMSVMAIDLDALGSVNARFGRGAGDKLLAASAQALVGACRDRDYVARAGGDELIVVLTDVNFGE